MDQPRTDEDQQLVARTQDGDAGAFDQLVVKYTPRLYGLVYNMTFESRGHERSPPGYFFQSLQIDPRFPRQILLLHLDPFHRGEHDAEFFKETRPPFSPQS